jgi:hypothetical protein
MITPKDYSESYNTKWTTEFNNVSSKALRDSWETLATAFNDCIVDNKETGEVKRRVVSMPTGSGKTTGLAHYLGMLPAGTRALVVTAFIKSADELEEVIGRGNLSKVIAVHSKNGKKISDIGNQQVLIVTHKHFTMNMYNDHINERNLIVIDEAIDLLTEYEIKNEDLRRLKNIVSEVCLKSPKTLEEAKNELDKLIGFIGITDVIHQQINAPKMMSGVEFAMKKTEFLVNDIDGFETLKLDRLRSIVKNNNCSRIALGKSLDEHKEKEYKRELLALIETIEYMLQDWFYYYSKNGTLRDASLHHVTMKLPNKSVVVLDATATTNHLYKLFDDVKLYSDSENARNYANVELYVAKGVKTGLTAMMTEPKAKAEVLIRNLEEHLGADTKALIVTRKKFVPFISDYKVAFKYQVENYGNLTGKNDWKDFDAVVLYGLLHKPKSYNINRHAVAKTPMDSMDDTDTRDKLIATDLASEVIQAVNRVRCRNVIDEEGNCEATKVFLTLPSGDVGEFILQSITNKMKNIVVKDWELDSSMTRTSSKKSSWLNSVITYVLANLQADENLTAVDVMKALEVPKSTYNDLCNSQSFIEALTENKLILQYPRGKTRGKAYYRID